jgi:hypothetical protein
MRESTVLVPNIKLANFLSYLRLLNVYVTAEALERHSFDVVRSVGIIIRYTRPLAQVGLGRCRITSFVKTVSNECLSRIVNEAHGPIKHGFKRARSNNGYTIRNDDFAGVNDLTIRVHRGDTVIWRPPESKNVACGLPELRKSN